MRLLPLCVGLLALAAPASARADAVVAELAQSTPIAAFGDVLAWSALDAASGRYRLVLQLGGLDERAEIADAAAPFDVSLGPDVRGRVVALYTRCRRLERGCDVYRYDVASRREHKVTAVSSPSFDEAWPVQWRDRVAFVRRARTHVRDHLDDHRPDPRGKRGGGPLADCDIPFVKTLSAGRASRRLDRAACGRTVGMTIRRDRIVQLTSFYEDFNAAAAEVRLLRARGGAARVLARGSSGLAGYSSFASPSLSASAVWLTRVGNRDPMNLLRIELASGRLTELDPKVPLAGRVARDQRGRFWYLQASEPQEDLEFDDRGPLCDPLQPCRLIRASADPFSSLERPLAPRLRLSAATGQLGAPPAGGLALAGDLTREVVRGRATVRREPLPAVGLELLRSVAGDGSGPYVATGRTAVTDAAGRWSFASSPRLSGFFVVVAPGLRLATRVVDVTA